MGRQGCIRRQGCGCSIVILALLNLWLGISATIKFFTSDTQLTWFISSAIHLCNFALIGWLVLSVFQRRSLIIGGGEEGEEEEEGKEADEGEESAEGAEAEDAEESEES